jgi:Nucleotide modification associated domain 3
MRVIVSRKGFDSASGGMPSPILPGGRLLSLPIPCDRPGSGIPYASIRSVAGSSVAEIMHQLHVREPSDGAHLDPDLARAAVPRAAGWRPLFGQDSQAERHLENQHVGPGDLFLFFGLFRQTVSSGGQLRWARGAPMLHILFGYLEIGEVRHVGSLEDVADMPWAAGHPHVRVWQRPFNTLYIAAAESALAPQRPGAGLFRFSARTRLTKLGESASIWQLPAAFAGCAEHLSYHLKASRWEVQPDGTVILHSVGRGQEFVTEADQGLANWTRQLIGAEAGQDDVPTAQAVSGPLERTMRVTTGDP